MTRAGRTTRSRAEGRPPPAGGSAAPRGSHPPPRAQPGDCHPRGQGGLRASSPAPDALRLRGAAPPCGRSARRHGDRGRGPRAPAVPGCDWRLQIAEGPEPVSWRPAHAPRAAGAQGILVPSHALGAGLGDLGLVLWRWNEAGGAAVAAIDDHGRLPPPPDTNRTAIGAIQDAQPASGGFSFQGRHASEAVGFVEGRPSAPSVVHLGPEARRRPRRTREAKVPDLAARRHVTPMRGPRRCTRLLPALPTAAAALPAIEEARRLGVGRGPGAAPHGAPGAERPARRPPDRAHPAGPGPGLGDLRRRARGDRKGRPDLRGGAELGSAPANGTV